MMVRYIRGGLAAALGVVLCVGVVATAAPVVAVSPLSAAPLPASLLPASPLPASLIPVSAVSGSPVSGLPVLVSSVLARPVSPVTRGSPTRTLLQAVDQDGGVWCAIAIARNPSGVRFTSAAEADAVREVFYRFTLTRIDAGGTSDLQQAGEATLMPDQRLVLSSSEVSLEQGGRYRAQLVLEDRNGVVCRREALS